MYISMKKEVPVEKSEHFNAGIRNFLITLTPSSKANVQYQISYFVIKLDGTPIACGDHTFNDRQEAIKEFYEA